ncbi:MAG: methyl-accepting chemotaxis protein [Spirochaetes bacterium]|nr:methyl-accepting chemotaxis protein [Spirochaetota bacterium]
MLTANILLWLALTPLESVLAALKNGSAVPDENKRLARKAGYRSTLVIQFTVLIGFFIGPIAGIAGNMAAGIADYTLAEALLIMAVNTSIGAMAGAHCIIAVENLLRRPMESLGLHQLEKNDRYVSMRGRILFPAVSSLVFALTLLICAAYGYLKAAMLQGIDPALFRSFFIEISLASLAILLWGVWLSYSVASDLSRRLKVLGTRIEQLSEGHGDLRLRADIARNDDIGRMASAFNGFLVVMGNLVHKIRGQAEQAGQSGQRLAEQVNSAEKSFVQLNQSLATVGDSAGAQNRVINEAKNRIDDIAASISVVADMVANQAGFVEQSSASISEMVANIASVTKTAARADELAENLTRLSVEGGEALKTSVASIRELEDVSRSVGAIVSSISKIAAQTNLLAMNAAIEAAHAGSAGAGFAVVADEVRTLAESASSSAREIVVLIKNMTQRISSGVTLADKAGASFNRINDGVFETTELVRTIAASMSEQKLGAEEILNSVSHLTEATQAIQDQSETQRRKSDEMRMAMDEIVQASTRISQAMQAELQSAADLSAVVRRVQDETGNNLSGTANLLTAVSNFKDT